MESIHFNKPSGLPGVSAVEISNSSRRWQVYHEELAVCLNSGGSAEWKYRGRVSRHEPRQILLMEPGELHCDQRVFAPCSYSIVFIDPALLNGAIESAMEVSSSGVHFAPEPKADPLLERLLIRLAQPALSDAPLLFQEALLAEFFGRLALRIERPMAFRAPSAVARAKELLIDCASTSISLDMLAAEVRINKFHLVHAFREQFGVPPHRFLNAVRVAKAARLLQGKGMTCAEVAQAVGFADQAHLTRLFKRSIGVTPSEFARQHAGVRKLVAI